MAPGTKHRRLTEAEVLAALRDCYDPEVPCNIVDLGLIYDVSVEPDRDAPGTGIPGVPPRFRVRVEMALTSPGCAAEGQIKAQIEGRLAAFETISRAEVHVVWEPRWTVERISAEGRRRIELGSGKRSNGLVQIQTQDHS